MNAPPEPPALAISASNCTGASAYSLALWYQGRLQWRDAAGSDAELAAAARDLCAAAGVAPAELRELRVDRGPGSYTGLRVAVTFARTLHAFGGARLLAATSFELLALAALDRGAPPAARLRPVLDGRRQRLLSAALQLDAGRLRTVAPPQALTADELVAALQPGERLLAPAALAPQLDQLAAARGASVHTAATPTAALLFDPRLQPVAATVAQLEPLYLLASYADPA